MNITDRRRILGPANAKPLVFDKSMGPAQRGESEEVSSETGNDAMYIENGIVGNSNGSSYLEVKSRINDKNCTLLLTSVYGPRPSRGAFNAKATLSVQFREVTLEKIPAGQLREVCTFLTNIFNAVVNLERYPKSGIDIFLSLIHSSSGPQDYELESIITTCVNGITLAFVDAGIEILDTVSAGMYKKNITAFMKNGTEVVGFWKDDDDNSASEGIMDIVEKCKEHYLQNRKTMIEYMIRSSKSSN
ncbi:LAME_0A05094g1_1 [Lachancea meyersii CBS 8951]|uniref:LAME_0A05094g1_1 n=1 Tax=Lachancea meyersii CBS 8951 TaxID=1266667 RepID=A0A1G4IQ37_9SACH|nr:LAME_0A05094g1_1 [Lachancea meyersii CBS 8951]